MSELPQCHDVVRSMLQDLPGWKALPHDSQRMADTYLRIEHEASGARVGAFLDKYRKRLRFSVAYPSHPCGTLGCARSWGVARFDEDPEDTIQVNPCRDPKAIARDFNRRLGGRAVEIWSKVAPQHTKELIEDDQDDQLLSELLGEDGRRSPGNDHRGTVYGEKWNARLYVTRSYGVDLDVHGATPDQARAILKIMRGEVL